MKHLFFKPFWKQHIQSLDYFYMFDPNKNFLFFWFFSKVTEEVSNIFSPILIHSTWAITLRRYDIKLAYTCIFITVQGAEGEVPILFLQQEQTCWPNKNLHQWARGDGVPEPKSWRLPDCSVHLQTQRDGLLRPDHHLQGRDPRPVSHSQTHLYDSHHMLPEIS